MNTVRELLRQNRVLDMGPLPAPRLAPNATVHQALVFMVRARRGAIVVVEQTQPVGIFSERDVVHRIPERIFTSAEERRRTFLRDVMSHPPVTVRRQSSLAEAIELMCERRHRHLVIVGAGGELRGLLTSSDIVQFITDQFPEETVNLPPRFRQQYNSAEGA